MRQDYSFLRRNIDLPLPPQGQGMGTEMEIYARFMRHLRDVPCSRPEVRVLASIQFTADMLGCSDAHVSKVLVDLGLRAPRLAFPCDFLHFVDQSIARTGWEVGGPCPSILELKESWEAPSAAIPADMRRQIPAMPKAWTASVHAV